MLDLVLGDELDQVIGVSIGDLLGILIIIP